MTVLTVNMIAHAVYCQQSATNLSMSSGKGAKERSLNSKYAAWAADQISTKYKVS